MDLTVVCGNIQGRYQYRKGGVSGLYSLCWHGTKCGNNQEPQQVSSVKVSAQEEQSASLRGELCKRAYGSPARGAGFTRWSVPRKHSYLHTVGLKEGFATSEDLALVTRTSFASYTFIQGFLGSQQFVNY